MAENQFLKISKTLKPIDIDTIKKELNKKTIKREVFTKEEIIDLLSNEIQSLINKNYSYDEIAIFLSEYGIDIKDGRALRYFLKKANNLKEEKIINADEEKKEKIIHKYEKQQDEIINNNKKEDDKEQAIKQQTINTKGSI